MYDCPGFEGSSVGVRSQRAALKPAAVYTDEWLIWRGLAPIKGLQLRFSSLFSPGRKTAEKMWQKQHFWTEWFNIWKGEKHEEDGEDGYARTVS